MLRRIQQAGVIGIFRIDAPEKCILAMEALMKGGLNVFEVTLTTPGAMDVISEARKKFGDPALIGIGTVLDRDAAEKGIDAGAQFIVSPSLDKDVVELCKTREIVSCPGTFTGTEIVQALKWGADIIKVFPIGQVGPDYIRAIRCPLPQARLVPTGGVDASNLGEYLRAGAFAVGIGGNLIPQKAISEARYDVLTEGAARVVGAVKKARDSR
jgi:2-dehydro-3-deoxyphosphogluconate aldolase/(4S)-4-hydroxy-2-oxoglutarate aldolase